MSILSNSFIFSDANPVYNNMPTTNDNPVDPFKDWCKADEGPTPPIGNLRYLVVHSFVTPEHYDAFINYCLSHGFKWFSENRLAKYDVIVLDYKAKDITSADIDSCTVFKTFGCTHSATSVNSYVLERWLRLNGDTTIDDSHKPTKPVNDDEQQRLNEENVTTVEPPMSNEPPVSKTIEPSPTANDPFAGMVDYIAAEVTRRVGAMISEENISRVVNDIMSKQHNRLVITIDNKRTEKKTDINEPTHKALVELIGVLKSGCWAAVVGPTGGGKTIGGMQYARATGIKHVGIKQMNQMLMPHDLVGFIDAAGHYNKGAWTDAIIGQTFTSGTVSMPDCNVPGQEDAIIIIDEMDNANANIIMLVKALATGYIAMPYGLQRINPNLSVMATMNTWGTGATREYVGRAPQDAAMLNEFQFVEWDYDVDFEWQLLQQTFRSFDGRDIGDYKMEDMMRLHAMFKSMRVKIEQQKVRCIVSTRNIINVARMLLTNPTWPIHATLKKSVYKGLKDEEIKRIEAPEHWSKKSSNVVRSNVVQSNPNKVTLSPTLTKPVKDKDSPF